MLMTDSRHLVQLWCDFISAYGLHGAVIRKEEEGGRENEEVITESVSCYNKVLSGGSVACQNKPRAPAEASAFLQLSVWFWETVREETKKMCTSAASQFRLPHQLCPQCGCNKRSTDSPEVTVKAHKVREMMKSNWAVPEKIISGHPA